MDRVFDGDRLRAVLNPGPGRDLFLTFDYRKDRRSGFGTAPKSGRLAARGWDHLHIQTTCNDWFLNDDTFGLIEALERLAARYGRVHALGYSMGAFGALRLAAGLQGARVTAISPLLSILPDIATWEDRYVEDRAHWQKARALAELGPNPDLSGFLVHDPDLPQDRAHAMALAQLFPGLRVLLLSGGGHPATRALRESGDNDSPLALALGEVGDGTRLLAAHAALTDSPLDGGSESP